MEEKIKKRQQGNLKKNKQTTGDKEEIKELEHRDSKHKEKWQPKNHN